MGLSGLVLASATLVGLRNHTCSDFRSICGRAIALICVAILFITSGMSYTVWRAHMRLNDRLDRQLENVPVSVRILVTGLPKDLINGWEWQARILDEKSLPGLPQRILLRWFPGPRSGPYDKPQRPPEGLPDLRPGQEWQMTVRLRRIHGARNFYGFNYDAYMFASGLRAAGTVSGPATLLRDRPWLEWGTAIERLRFALRKSMSRVLQNRRYGSVLIALVMGDQNGISDEDWKVFNLTGITHLVSISGSHITMLAALGSLGVFRIWRRLRWQGKYIADHRPGQVVAAAVGLVIATCYSLLAGWGIPAQRTLTMLAVLFAAVVLRIQLKATTLLSISAFCILLLDPWAVLSVGFVLSFAAIACLMLWGSREAKAIARPAGRSGKLMHKLWLAAQMQLFMSVALLPLLIGIFHQYAFASPIVNAIAIPVIGGLVTPLALLLALFCLIPWWPTLTTWLAAGVHALLEAVLQLATSMAELEWAAPSFAATHVFWTLSGLMGLLIFSLPRGIFGRYSALVLLIPVLFFRAERPQTGCWILTALDVGQGAAVLIRTARHNVLYDTGVRSSVSSDAGQRVVIPYLQALNISHLDQLIISHSDLDHVGGAVSVLQQVDVRHAYTSFMLNAHLEDEQRLLGKDIRLRNPQATFDFCERGRAFEYDGVRFQFLHPEQVQGHPVKAANDQSCVLLISGKFHSALLTGDIGTIEEAVIMQNNDPLPVVDVVMAPHHGSAGSSSPDFVQKVRPAVAFAQAGYLNRYGHPAPEIVERWRAAGQVFLDTISSGAITMTSGFDGLRVNTVRGSEGRYWDDF